MVAVGGGRTTLPDSAGSSPARGGRSGDLSPPVAPANPPTAPGQLTGEGAQQRRLARAVDPDEPDDVAGRDDEIEVGEQDAGAVPGGQAAGDQGGTQENSRWDGSDGSTTVTGSRARTDDTGRPDRSPAVFVVLLVEDGVGHLVEHLLEGDVLLPRGTAADQPRLQVVVAAHRDPAQRPHPVLRPAAQPAGQLPVDEHCGGLGDR